MNVARYQISLDAPIAAVWKFHESAREALPLLAPPGSDPHLELVDEPQRVGARVVIVAKGPLGKKMRWAARYETFEPPHICSDGKTRARFVDIQDSGPFKYWRHEHLMESVTETTATLTDTIEYIVPLGFLGNLANTLFVRRQLDQMFAHRHRVTREQVMKHKSA